MDNPCRTSVMTIRSLATMADAVNATLRRTGCSSTRSSSRCLSLNCPAPAHTATFSASHCPPHARKRAKRPTTSGCVSDRPEKRRGRQFSSLHLPTGLDVLRAEARDVPMASPPSVREAGEARACAASAARPNSAERSEADKKPRSGACPDGSRVGRKNAVFPAITSSPTPPGALSINAPGGKNCASHRHLRLHTVSAVLHYDLYFYYTIV